MDDTTSPEIVKTVKVRDSFVGDAREHFGARISEAGVVISTPTKDPFLLRASHNVQAPHNYNPVHEHNTRYKEWYSTHFAVVTEEYRKPKGQRGTALGTSDDSGRWIWLALLLLVVAVYFGCFPTGTVEEEIGEALVARSEVVNETAIAELRNAFDLLDKEHEKTKGELDNLNALMQQDIHSVKIEELRAEVALLAQRFQNAEIEQGQHLSSQADVTKELYEISAETTTTLQKAAVSDLHSQLEQIKGEVKELTARMKATQEQHNIAQEKALAADTVSADVKAAVLLSIDGFLSENKVLQECTSSAEGCSLRLKQQIVNEVKKLVIADIAQSSEELVEKYVQRSVWEAVAGYTSEGMKSELEGSIKGVLRAVYEESLGGVDWMLSINGAEIVSHSASYDPCEAEKGMRVFVCRAEQVLNKPLQLSAETIIKTDATQGGAMGEQWTQLGHCWAMNGTGGFVEVRLDRPVEPTKFVLEHAPSRLSFQGGTSAPRRFRVQGWLSGDLEEQRETLVEGEYLINLDGFNAHIQPFPIRNAEDGRLRQIDRVRMEVESNHGNPTFTCLYHLRLYAKIPPLPMTFPSS